MKKTGSFTCASIDFKRSIIYILLMLLISIPALCSPTPKSIVIVANRLVLEDFEGSKLQNIQKMINNGTIGLISPNCRGEKLENSVMLTASTGTPCTADIFLDEIYDSKETIYTNPIAEEFERRTGISPKNSKGLFLGLAEAINENIDYKAAVMGSLGAAFKAKKLTTATIGNNDDKNLKMRAYAVLAIDHNGLIDKSLISEKLNLNENQLKVINSSDLSVLYFNESTLLDNSKVEYSALAFQKARLQMLNRLDSLIGELISKYPNNAIIYLISLSPQFSKRWNRLTPILVYPSEGNSILNSPSTRTPGLITASDIAPTIIRNAALTPANIMVGRPAFSETSDNSLQELKDLNSRVNAQDTLIRPVLWSVGVLGAISITLACLIISFNLKLNKKIIKLVRFGMLIFAASLGAILLGVITPAGVSSYVLGIIISIALLILISIFIGKKLGSPIYALYGIIALLVLVDSWTGGGLCKYSLLSSFQISGFRYYGIGNEYAGVLIGTASIFLLHFKLSKSIAILISIIIFATFGSGMLGANFGALIASVITFGLLITAYSNGRFRKIHLILFLGLAFFAFTAASYLDYKTSGALGSHGARAALISHLLGVSYYLELAFRKIAMNLGILISAQAVKAFMMFIPVGVLWIYGIQDKLKLVLKSDAKLNAGFKAILVGSAAAFLFNDSGFVMAAIMIAAMLIYILDMLLLICQD